MVKLILIPKMEFDRVSGAFPVVEDRLQVLADMCRANALTAVKRAGSGHLGSSFSAMDIVAHLYWKEMNTIALGLDHVDRDIYFSSKGHDVPGLYSVLYALGVLPAEKLMALRRLGGLEGHPDIIIPGIEANSGSLGMGISKGRGMAWGKKHLGRGGCVYVLTGDGEWQEGQNFEALQGAAALKTSNLVVIMDHNKIQSDKPIDQIVSLGDLVAKFRTFGWHVVRCDGHDHTQLAAAMAEIHSITDRPKILIADTIKGRGVSFMENPQALVDGGGYYKWHSGAPADEVYAKGHREILDRVNRRLTDLGVRALQVDEVLPDGTLKQNVSLEGEPDSRGAALPSLKSQAEFVADAFGQTLVELGARRKDLVVLDADLSADCRVRPFELKYPERFIECGIAEQDMVSMADGLARQGLLPVVNSFASFLASRANEQIYNNASENTKIIYVCHYAGLIPAGPGKSHQSIRDISLLGALPNMEIIQPCSCDETKMVMEYAIDRAESNVAIRLIIGPSPRRIELPDGYRLVPGKGVTLKDGDDVVMIAYGPVMLHEALIAADLLSSRGVDLKVVNMPWLNRIDGEWLGSVAAGAKSVVVVEDHSPVGGLGDRIRQDLDDKGLLKDLNLRIWGVEGYPAFGAPPEALKAHQLDGESLANRILANV